MELTMELMSKARKGFAVALTTAALAAALLGAASPADARCSRRAAAADQLSFS